LSKEYVQKMNFGGFEKVDGDRENREKSRKEIMSEIINKSKQYKRERSNEKLEKEEMTEKLDEEFSNLQKRISPLIRTKTIITTKDENDDYDVTVRTLAYEIRAHPTERLKTEEETAMEEKQKLERLERERLRRMKMDTPIDKKSLKLPSGDALEEEEDTMTMNASVFSLNEKEAYDKESNEVELSNGNDLIEDQEENQNEDDESEDDEDRKEALLESEDTMDRSLENEEESNETSENEETEKVEEENGGLVRNEDDTIPYTFEVPNSHKQFLEWVKNRSASQLELIIQRIRACNHLALAQDNKLKLQEFYSILLKHFLFVSKRESSISSEEIIAELNLLTKVLFELSRQLPNTAASCVKDILQNMQSSLAVRLQNSKVSSGNSCWPQPSQLLLLKLIAVLFPVSDFRHAVVTPALLLMGQCLAQCPIRRPSDIVKGLFLCNLFLSYLKDSKRYCPEAICFLINLLKHSSASVAIEKRPNSTHLANDLPVASFLKIPRASSTFDEQVRFASGDLESRKEAIIQKKTENNAEEYKGIFVDTRKNIQLEEELKSSFHFWRLFSGTLSSISRRDYYHSIEFRFTALYMSIMLLSKFAHLYSDKASFQEIFFPAKEYLSILSKDDVKLPFKLKEAIRSLHIFLDTTCNNCIRIRQPLQWCAKKLPQLKMLNPRFQETYSIRKDYDRNTERAERKKLRNSYKKELKGAQRELRKDNWFIEREKAKRKAMELEERDRKHKKIMSMLEDQQAEWKRSDKEKQKLKKLSAFK